MEALNYTALEVHVEFTALHPGLSMNCQGFRIEDQNSESSPICLYSAGLRDRTIRRDVEKTYQRSSLTVFSSYEVIRS
jgi:hypothetical protein